MSRSAHLVRATVAVAVLLGPGLGLAGCGGKVPAHSGYKSAKARPWEKAKTIPFKKGEASVEGDLDYATYKRAKWWALDLVSDGELTVTLTQHAKDDRKVDIALEVLDGNNQIIGKADAEEEDAYEEEKSRTLYELRAGRYLVHLYLQSRLGAAEYELKAVLQPKSISGTPDSSAQLTLLPPLPVVAIEDDTPIRKKPTGGGGSRPPVDRPVGPATTPPPSGSSVTARIINVTSTDGGVEITINRGTDTAGVVDGAKGRVVGVKNADVVLKSCGTRSCRANVRATADEVQGKSVVVNP